MNLTVSWASEKIDRLRFDYSGDRTPPLGPAPLLIQPKQSPQNLVIR
jgi:hypothetical protein